MNTFSKVLLAALIAFLAFAPTTREPASRWDRHSSPNASRELGDALFGTNLVLAQTRYLQGPWVWLDAYDDDECSPASDSAECYSCLASAERENTRALRACERARDRSRNACSNLRGVARRRCLDDADSDYDTCETEAEDAYTDAEASCEGSECFGDC